MTHKARPVQARGARLAADPALRQRFGAVQRVKLGLEDADLAGLRDALAPGRRPVVVAKHLCGAASDYALRAIAAASGRASPPLAVLLGTCCHHRCEWGAYPARDFLHDALGVADPARFGQLCRLSSRGVDAFDASEGASGGRRAKDLLDEGRARFLRAHGYDVQLVQYVDASVTPENALIVATSNT